VVGRPPDDRELARRAKEGDVDAYASLLRLHEGAARRLALVVCGSAVDADDAAQDAFVKAWYALAGFRDGAPFRPWLLRIVVNEARNQRRSAGRRASYELRWAEDRASPVTASGGAASSPEAAALATDRRRQLVGALSELPAPQRDVVACRYLVGLDEAETATVLELPRGTVKSRAARGLARLRELLPERVEIGGDADA
jgi:RNA polymerase sigma factor (sigma-70 family)